MVNNPWFKLIFGIFIGVTFTAWMAYRAFRLVAATTSEIHLLLDTWIIRRRGLKQYGCHLCYRRENMIDVYPVKGVWD